jgi:putative membrane protein
MNRNEILLDTLFGAIGGFVATIPMTIFMKATHRELPPEEQYALPPKRITARTGQAVGIPADECEPKWGPITYAGHFGYGTTTGAIFGAISDKTAILPANVLGGIEYGLAVWSGSYLGWLPATGLHPPATRDTARRNAIMVGAHVIWGAALGLVVGALKRHVSLSDGSVADTEEHSHESDRSSRRAVGRAGNQSDQRRRRRRRAAAGGA